MIELRGSVIYVDAKRAESERDTARRPLRLHDAHFDPAS